MMMVRHWGDNGKTMGSNGETMERRWRDRGDNSELMERQWADNSNTLVRQW